jgi:hypothetical protein
MVWACNTLHRRQARRRGSKHAKKRPACASWCRSPSHQCIDRYRRHGLMTGATLMSTRRNRLCCFDRSFIARRPRVMPRSSGYPHRRGTGTHAPYAFIFSTESLVKANQRLAQARHEISTSLSSATGEKSSVRCPALAIESSRATGTAPCGWTGPARVPLVASRSPHCGPSNGANF